MENGPLWRPRAPRVPRGGVRRRGGWPECPAGQRGGAAGRPRSHRGRAWARLASGGASELAGHWGAECRRRLRGCPRRRWLRGGRCCLPPSLSSRLSLLSRLLLLLLLLLVVVVVVAAAAVVAGAVVAVVVVIVVLVVVAVTAAVVCLEGCSCRLLEVLSEYFFAS